MFFPALLEVVFGVQAAAVVFQVVPETLSPKL